VLASTARNWHSAPGHMGLRLDRKLLRTVMEKPPTSTTADSALPPVAPKVPVISRRELLHRLSPFATRSTPRALWYFFSDLALYAIAIAGVLFLPNLPSKLLSSVLAGLALGRLFSFAHNAAHENLAENRKLNRVMAYVAFTPFFYSYRLWAFEHHKWHHALLNDQKPDAYKPFSKAEFDRLPAWRRVLERFYRAPNVVGWGAYYLIERHFRTKIYPPEYVVGPYRRVAWINTAWLAAYAFLFGMFLIQAPAYSVNLTISESLALGFLIPFLVFEVADGFTLYAQHTDPLIPWFRDGGVNRDGPGRGDLLSVHLQVPLVYRWWSHETHAHPVHHLLPGIPFFRVKAAQQELDRLLGPWAIVRRLSLAWWFDTMRRCKLYDWDKHQWLDFSGNPTGPSLLPRLRALEALSVSGARTSDVDATTPAVSPCRG